MRTLAPSQTLDCRADLLARLDHPLVRQGWKAQFALDWNSVSPDKATLARNVDTLYSAVGGALRAAELFHVVPDMSTLVEAAAAGLEPLDRFDHTLAPVPIGLVRFDQGLQFIDVRGNLMRVNWLLWMPVNAGNGQDVSAWPSTALYMWNDTETDPDVISLQVAAMGRDGTARERRQAEQMRRAFGRWGFIGAEIAHDEMRLGAARQLPDEEKQASIAAAGDTPTAQTNIIRAVHALWLLLGQTVARSREAEVDRPAAGRARAAGLPSRVTVVELRRSAGAPSEGPAGSVEWSHRWLVRGFWRWNVCGQGHPLAQELEPGKWRARVWVNGFVKGPADKPLVQSEKVYQLRR